MHHPFVNDLSEKSADDLQQTIQDLHSKLNFVYKTQNQPLINQLHMVLESYKSEYGKRMDELYKKQNVQDSIKVSKDTKW